MQESIPIKYKHIECKNMTEEEIRETSILYSENYGVYENGNRIKLSPLYIKKMFVDPPDRRVVLAYHNGELVGHMFYVRRLLPRDKRYVTWVLQLVTRKDYRGNRIATGMAQSVFCLSDNQICGLFTSNPATIKALETATMRRLDKNVIKNNVEKLKLVSSDFLANSKWLDTFSNCFVNTDFDVSHKELAESIKKAYPNGDFPLDPNLPPKHEWLAFVTRRQKIIIPDGAALQEYLAYSEDIIRQAYSFMKMDNQPWASHTTSEISYLLKQEYIKKGNLVYDFGCGTGRHSIELGMLGYNVIGIDNNIKNAEQNRKNLQSVNFINGDVRSFKFDIKADVILCLYDVIGSFPEEIDNFHILENIYDNLKNDGILILSVMNMEITRKRCKRHSHIVEDIKNNMESLLMLQGSQTMEKTGDVFDGERLLLDDSTGVVYRKEQFLDGDHLPLEYIVRDRRYSEQGIKRLVEKAGFSILDEKCVMAGRFEDTSKPKKNKEILIVAKKTRGFSKIFITLREFIKHGNNFIYWK